MYSKFELLGKMGNLVTRLAITKREIEKAQKIRFDVFHVEKNADNRPSILNGIDQDAHDLECDHLLVIDYENPLMPKIVATQRFKIGTASKHPINFYSQAEFDLKSLSERYPNQIFMELGRSCVLPAYRSKRTMELLWQGTWAYALSKGVDVMTGCASFNGTNPKIHMAVMHYLAQNFGTEADWRVSATGDEIIDLSAITDVAVDLKTAMRSMPPLIKGYMRLGARFSHEAVIDRVFGTIDMLVVLPVKDINPRYIRHYGVDAQRYKPIAAE